jgi:hypothetical protein
MNNLTCLSDSLRGYGLDIGFIDHLYTELVIARNYSAIADLVTHIKSFPARSDFTSRWLVTAPSVAASGLKSFLNGGSLPTEHPRN